MNLIKTQGDNYIFELGKREKRLLTDILKLYPVIPSSHHRVTKSASNPQIESQQRLLDDALAEQCAENKRQLEVMLNEESRFKPAKTAFQFSLNQYQLEWLLQVLNDIRVGSWLILGEPDEKIGKKVKLTAENSEHLLAMEASAYFQSVLLRAIEERESSR